MNDGIPGLMQHDRAVIRDFEDKDLDQVMELQLTSWRLTYGELASAEFFSSDLPQAIEEEWRHATFRSPDFALVAIRSGRLVGFTTVLSKDDHAFIDHLHVSADCHRQGVGRSLLSMAAHRIHLQGHKVARLTVYQANKRARAFYSALAGKEIDTFIDTSLGQPHPCVTVEWKDNVLSMCSEERAES